MSRNMYEIEQELWEQGYELIAGVDEVGRGPLAGPVVSAAVVLRKGQIIEGVTDSKKISEAKREKLIDKILDEAVAYSISFVDEKVIDDINIRNATFKAMNEAVNSLSVKPDFVLIDGNAIEGITLPHKTVIKGDLNCNCIAAASIVAKVTRDRFMVKLAEKYPEYDFEKHKGYGTKLHYEKLKEHGISEVHRKTFLKNLGEK
jgi:ribonuclease HII